MGGQRKAKRHAKMRVEIKGDDEGSVPDLLFRVAQEKRGEIDMKANKKHVAPMLKKSIQTKQNAMRRTPSGPWMVLAIGVS